MAEEGELVPQKKPKQQKTAKGQRRASFVESKEDYSAAEVHPSTLVWDHRLELEEAAIPRGSSIKEF